MRGKTESGKFFSSPYTSKNCSDCMVCADNTREDVFSHPFHLVKIEAVELRFCQKIPISRRGLLLILWVVLSVLFSGNIGFCQDGSTSFSRQPSWNAGEPSATFVIRPDQKRRMDAYDEQPFPSENGGPVALSPLEGSAASLQQPYRSIDQAFHDAPRRWMPSHFETASLVPQLTYSFDSREWVERYPEALRYDHDAFSSGHVSPVGASLRESLFSVETVPAAPMVAHNVRVSSTEKREPIDLTPNPVYAKHLKHADVCGVVVVQSNFPLTEIRTLLHEIELLQRDLNQYMAVPAPKEKIELSLFKDEASYIRFLKDVFPKAPLDRRALYIKETGKPGVLLVQRTKDFEIDLRHEMTHAVIHASIANVPIWLDEGLAKYFEQAPDERSAKNPYLKYVRFHAKFGAVPSLSRLEKLELIGEMGSREYRDSWSWVHFLIHHSPQTHRLLAGYLQLLASLPEQPSDARRKDKIQIPPLGQYITDVVKDPKGKYLEHFRTWAVDARNEEQSKVGK